MDILLARTEIKEKPKKVKVSKLKKEVEETGNKLFYFDRENSHKEMMNLIDSFEDDSYTAYFREVKFGLADEEYMYEVHVM